MPDTSQSCPQCHFSHKWDGSQCGHCGYPGVTHDYEAYYARSRSVDQSQASIGKRNKFARQTAFALVAFVAVYYVAILAHWEYVVHAIAVIGFKGPIVLLQLLALFLIALPMIGVKGQWAGWRWAFAPWNRLRTVLLLSVAVALCGVSFVLLQSWPDIFASEYAKKYSPFWLALFVLAFYVYLFRVISVKGSVRKFMQEIRAFPIVSPVFCFGAPALWRKSLEGFSLTSQQVSAVGLLSVVAGVLFVVSLVLYYVARHLASTTKEPSVIIGAPSETADLGAERYAVCSLAAAMLGLAGVTFVAAYVGYLICTQ